MLAYYADNLQVSTLGEEYKSDLLRQQFYDGVGLAFCTRLTSYDKYPYETMVFLCKKWETDDRRLGLMALEQQHQESSLTTTITV